MSLKQGSKVPLRTTSTALEISFSGATPAVSSGPGWRTLFATPGANQLSITCLWEDIIDITGIQATDFSMVNLGGTATPLGPPNRAGTGNPQTVIDVSIVSATPLNITDTEWLYLSLGIERLSGAVDRQNILFYQSRSYETTAGGGFLMPMLAATQYSGATSLSTTRLYVYRLVNAYVLPFYDQVSGNAITPVPTAGSVNIPSTLFQVGVELVEYDAISTAYAIYRGNDLQQSYDEP